MSLFDAGYGPIVIFGLAVFLAGSVFFINRRARRAADEHFDDTATPSGISEAEWSDSIK
ncbi:hypothetical protein [Microbacterium sp. cx-59]|uniref:hypothetical protein n=1 Tax=Microbacterium sp. cx-59 TaxID=2891207 RepID=UPI001E2F2461|nr:hypothetical protein [Microbacterium sp. cx-59]MCC4906988.1 hypothetical protein [Microbacterium sp. cx-59]